MSQQDNFIGGFIAGTILGGVVGGVLGAVVASRITKPEETAPPESFELKGKSAKSRRRVVTAPTEQSIEAARRGLEDKIAQLNDAIDDVRQQLGGVNGSPREEIAEAIRSDD